MNDCKTQEYFQLINRLYSPNEKLYEINFDKFKGIMDFILTMTNYCPNTFYGVSILPSGRDCRVVFRLSAISFDGIRASSVFEKAVSFDIEPIDEHFLLTTTFKDVFVRQ